MTRLRGCCAVHLVLGFLLSLAGGGQARDVLVFVAPGEADAYLPAARAMASLLQGEVVRFEPADLDAVLARCRKTPPRAAVFVLPPGAIDVDLAHRILALAVRVDDDPFVDFEYGFVTGRDGAAASRFVERIAAARKRRFGKRAAMFGSWEGAVGPMRGALTAFSAIGFSAESFYVKMRDDEETRRADAKRALTSLGGRDALLFFSHGYPDEMGGCFRAEDLRRWDVHLAPAVLVNCACWNGAPGRWFAPAPDGPVAKGAVAPEDSIALQLLDSGVSAFVGGVDPWHGPLASQVFGLIVDDGMRLGEATKRMFDRLAIEFLPERIRFAPTLEEKDRFAGEGTRNRRHNGAGMILYGDPTFAPFARYAARTSSADVSPAGEGVVRIRLTRKPLVRGIPGEDYMIALNRLIDYYSVRSSNAVRDLSLEIYQVVPLPEGFDGGPPPSVRVLSARCGDENVPAGTPRALVERTPDGKRLHLVVPVGGAALGPTGWALRFATRGVGVLLEARRGS